MLEAMMLWNEPNNLSHWDFELDPDWSQFAHMTCLAARAIRAEKPSLPKVLGGVSPIDPQFIENMAAHGVLAEVDAGLGRVGVAPGEPLLQLARTIENLPHLRFAGITFYPGHIKGLDESGLRAMAQLSDLLRGILDDFRTAGIEVGIVSGGSTPTLFHSHEVHGVTEIRPGTYVFNDLNTIRSGACALEDCAATILATVVSTALPGQMIIDGGSKTFSSDRLANSAEVTFGQVVEAPGARFHKMNEEHGFVDLAHAEAEFNVGDRVRVIPNHICVAVNLHEKVYGLRGDTVEEVWSVDARGKLQ